MLKILTQILIEGLTTPAGERHCTDVGVVYCAAIGPTEPNEHTAELSTRGIFVPLSVINVPPISPLDDGVMLETTGTACLDSG
jgi:hypothetical protein